MKQGLRIVVSKEKSTPGGISAAIESKRTLQHAVRCRGIGGVEGSTDSVLGTESVPRKSSREDFRVGSRDKELGGIGSKKEVVSCGGPNFDPPSGMSIGRLGKDPDNLGDLGGKVWDKAGLGRGSSRMRFKRKEEEKKT